MRLIRPLLDAATYIPANRRLGAIARRLAPIADGRAALAALARLAAERDALDAVVPLEAIREALEGRATRVDRKVMFDRVLARSAGALAVERARVGTWTLKARGIRAIAPALADSVRQTKTAMARAIESPTAARYDAWRRRTKDLFLQARLVEGRCSGLRAMPARLEALDDCLDAGHNIAVLERLLTTEALGSRRDTAEVLRLLRYEQRLLRARALTLARAALRDRPGGCMRRAA